MAALLEAGHDVRATDLTPPVFERPEEGEADYYQADLTDAGDAFAVVRGAEAVVHTAAIPEPTQNPPHVVFQNNIMATFNALEAAIRFGVSRFVNTSSETVPGFFFPERPVLPDYVPVDEEHPIRPQDPYATAKAAVLAFTQAVAVEYRAAGVRCNAVLPSVIDTPANRAAQPDADTSRWVPPSQVAAVIRFLCGDGSAPTSGAAIPVYGRA